MPAQEPAPLPAQLPRLAGDPKSWRVVVLADPDAVPPKSLHEALMSAPGIPVSLRQDLKPADEPLMFESVRYVHWTFARRREQTQEPDQDRRGGSGWLARVMRLLWRE